MKDKVEKNEIILDTSGTECPIPVLKARNFLNTFSKFKALVSMSSEDSTFLVSSFPDGSPILVVPLPIRIIG